jgi:hypothetical protein
VANDELRAAILRATNDANNDQRLPLTAMDYLEALSLTEDGWTDVSNALRYLMEKGFIRASAVPVVGRKGAAFTVSGITPAGIDEVEGSTKPQPGAVHFHGPVGAAQIGNHNTANVVQSFGADFQALVDALIAFRDDTSRDDSAAALHVLASQAASEAQSQGSITVRLAKLVIGIGVLIQTSGAIIPAYQALYLAASHLGIHGLPPP